MSGTIGVIIGSNEYCLMRPNHHSVLKARTLLVGERANLRTWARTWPGSRENLRQLWASQFYWITGLKILNAHGAHNRLQLRRGLCQFFFGVGVFNDAAAGPGTGSEAVSGDFCAADSYHVLTIARGVAPADGTGVETAVGFSGANQRLCGSSWGAADGRCGVAANSTRKGGGGLFYVFGNRCA